MTVPVGTHAISLTCVAEDASVEVRGDELPYVSRGGLKLVANFLEMARQ